MGQLVYARVLRLIFYPIRPTKFLVVGPGWFEPSIVVPAAPYAQANDFLIRGEDNLVVAGRCLMFVFCIEVYHCGSNHYESRCRSAALQSRAKGLFAWLCKSSDVQRLGKDDIARLLDALGLPRIADKDAL